eukprot:1670532-Pleurochrysis_carterae.AAC.2
MGSEGRDGEKRGGGDDDGEGGGSGGEGGLRACGAVWRAVACLVHVERLVVAAREVHVLRVERLERQQQQHHLNSATQRRLTVVRRTRGRLREERGRNASAKCAEVTTPMGKGAKSPEQGDKLVESGSGIGRPSRFTPGKGEGRGEGRVGRRRWRVACARRASTEKEPLSTKSPLNRYLREGKTTARACGMYDGRCATVVGGCEGVVSESLAPACDLTRRAPPDASCAT